MLLLVVVVVVVTVMMQLLRGIVVIETELNFLSRKSCGLEKAVSEPLRKTNLTITKSRVRFFNKPL